MSLKQQLSALIKPLAYTLFVISTIAWIMVFVIPFLDFSLAQTAGIITVLIIVGEITFYVAILLLGKPLWHKIKQKFTDYLKQKND